MPRKTVAAALAALALAAIPTASAGAGTRWSTILDDSDSQAEQVVTVGVHPFPGSGAAPGQYKPGAPRWVDEWYVRLPGDTDYLVEPTRTGGPEFREVVVPAGALLEVGWGGDVYIVDVSITNCAGPDVNLIDYSEPHFNVPALPLSEGRTSVSVTCERPAPPVSLPPATTPPTPPTPPTRQLLPPTVTIPATPTPTPTAPAAPAPTVPELDLTTTVRAARPELPVTGAHTGLFAAIGLTMTGLGLGLLHIANRRNK